MTATTTLVTRTDADVSGDLESAVLSRYARGAQQVEQALCCPTDGYDPTYLKNIPQEIIDKDYGCGDPSAYVEQGDTVIDLGSGAGKICYILAQKVGADGQVIGLDFNDAMLNLARKYEDEMADKLGYRNVRFHKARIQDMALDLDRVEQWLQSHPVIDIESLGRLNAYCDQLRQQHPLIPSESIDAIVSNCVLNLVRTEEKAKLFTEMFRVLKRGGKAIISDIVCDEPPTKQMKNDPHLWSGCISGAFLEEQFLAMFQDAGFHGIEILKRQEEPWQTIDGIEFRSMTVRAYKGKQGPCHERNQAVVYRGPWKQVCDDDGHVYYRGRRMAVCDKTYKLLTDPRGPYVQEMIGIEPYESIPADQAEPFHCKSASTRHPRQTKGHDYDATLVKEDASCAGDSCC